MLTRSNAAQCAVLGIVLDNTQVYHDTRPVLHSLVFGTNTYKIHWSCALHHLGLTLNFHYTRMMMVLGHYCLMYCDPFII